MNARSRYSPEQTQNEFHFSKLSSAFHHSCIENQLLPTMLLSSRLASFLKSTSLCRICGRFASNEIFTPDFNPNVETSSKTEINIIGNDESEQVLYIEKYNQAGFRLSNKLFVYGPMAVFPRTVFQWKVKSISNLDASAFKLFEMLEPKLDVLVLGLGDKDEQFPTQLRKELTLMRRFGIEALPTDTAVGIYNFLVNEGRYVAGAFIPPKKVYLDEEDMHLVGEELGAKRWKGEISFGADKTKY